MLQISRGELIDTLNKRARMFNPAITLFCFAALCGAFGLVRTLEGATPQPLPALPDVSRPFDASRQANQIDEYALIAARYGYPSSVELRQTGTVPVEVATYTGAHLAVALVPAGCVDAYSYLEAHKDDQPRKPSRRSKRASESSVPACTAPVSGASTIVEYRDATSEAVVPAGTARSDLEALVTKSHVLPAVQQATPAHSKKGLKAEQTTELPFDHAAMQAEEKRLREAESSTSVSAKVGHEALAVASLLLLTALVVHSRSRQKRTIELVYDLSEAAQAEQSLLEAALLTLGLTQRMWRLDSQAAVTDWKRNAGAAYNAKRETTTVHKAVPPRVESNVVPMCLDLGKQKMFFLPDQVLYWNHGTFEAVDYGQLVLSSGTTQFIEEQVQTTDSRQVGTTWRYVRRDGGPDRRFNNNRQLPIMRYGVLTASSFGGLTFVFYTSHEGAASSFVDALRTFQSRWGKPAASTSPQTSHVHVELGRLVPGVPPSPDTPQMKAADQRQMQVHTGEVTAWKAAHTSVPTNANNFQAAEPKRQPDSSSFQQPALTHTPAGVAGGLSSRDAAPLAEKLPELATILQAPGQKLVDVLAANMHSGDQVKAKRETSDHARPLVQPDEQLSSLTLQTEPGDAATHFTLPPAPPPMFPRLVRGPLSDWTKESKTPEDLLQEFSLRSSARMAEAGRVLTTAAAKLRWVRPGESIAIQGFTITRGMIYCGPEKDYGRELGIIHPLLRALPQAVEMTALHYGRTYSDFSPGRRYQYLGWLEGGAQNATQPEDALLYFCGLERWLLSEDGRSEEFSVDREQVLAEVMRLSTVFHDASNGVGRSAARLADFIAVRSLDGSEPPSFPEQTERAYELPSYMRYGLGWFMREHKPFPSEWMLRWAYVEPNLYLRTPATRCSDAFQRAFRHFYKARFGEGLLVAPNKTKLKFSYLPTNTGYAVQHTFSDIPDISALSTPQQTLRALVDESTAAVEAYSRFCGRNVGREQTLFAFLTLPAYLWPAEANERLNSLRSDVVERLKPISGQELLTSFGEADAANPVRIVEVARGLAELQIGFEPDILTGARRPKLSDCIVLFPLQDHPAIERSGADYRKASLTVALAACVAAADGHAAAAELASAERLIEGWTHLPPDLRMRLRAQYRVEIAHPASLSALKTKLLALPQAEREELALGMAAIAASDGTVDPAEVKLLESLYRMLGLDVQSLYGHLSSAGSGRSGERQRSVVTGGALALDPERLARLQRESEQASAILHDVFAEDDSVPGVLVPEPAESTTAEDTTDSGSPLTGLDDRHAAFLMRILERAEWSRAELARIAAELHLMLDGALERINDAAFEQKGAAMMEGDDPVFVQTDLFEKA